MIRIYSNIYKLKKIWNEIYSSNKEMSFYQSYEWNKTLYERYLLLRADKKSYKIKFFVYSRNENDNPILIAPLMIPNNEEPIMFFGTINKAGILNFIYSDNVTDSDFVALITQIKKCYPDKDLALREIPRYTKLGKFLYSDNSVEKFFNRESVRCNIPESIDEFNSSLSKSVRQTIRTSYNRLNKDNLTSELLIDYGYRFSSNERSFLNDLHNKRKLQWGYKLENSSSSFLKRIKQHLRETLSDPIFMISKSKNFVYVRYLIDGKIVAYFLGLLKNDHLIVPTLIHDTDYNFYSPGLLMIHEFIEKTINEKNITVFDLSRGCEEYKLRYLPNPETYIQDFYVIK